MKDIDKKYFVIGIAVLLLIAIIPIIFGKTKTLKCTLNLTTDTAVTNEVYTATFKRNKLKNLVVNFKNSPTSNYLDMIDAIYDKCQSQLEGFKEAGGYTYALEKRTTYVAFESKINLDKIPDKTKIELGFNNQWTSENFKKDLEKNGFNCK